MAEKIKLTKTDLKKQKDSLKRYKRYLPTLLLKKQQLQMVIRQLELQINEKRNEKNARYQEMMAWIQVFGEDVGIQNLLRLSRLETDMGNIAGVDIPIFNAVSFEELPYSLYMMPPWVDKAIKEFKTILQFDIELLVLDKQLELLNNELRTTSQRVNLFEKVKIPETKVAIRKIQIALGDQQTASVVRGKISKNKISQRED